jgi:probable HAF family extracellular repeat protein
MKRTWILLTAASFISCKEVSEPGKPQIPIQAAVTAATEIQIVDLGTLGGGWSHAVGINDRGQVVGAGETPSGDVHAFLWDKGTLTDIGNFLPAAINNRGQIVGMNRAGAVIWERGVITELGTLGGPFSRLLGFVSGPPGFGFLPTPQILNQSGTVIGVSTTASGETHAFVWRHGEMTDLGTLGGNSSTPVAIDDGGQIVGVSTTADGEEHAFLWKNGTMQDIGSGIRPAAFNNAGLIAGTSPAGGAVIWQKGELQAVGDERIRRALLVNERGDVAAKEEDGDVLWIWNKGVLTNVSGNRYANPIALNNQGELIAVGSYGGFPVASFNSIVWQDRVTTILPALWCDPPRSPDYYLCNSATAINNRGDIVGASMINQGEGFTYHAVLWTAKKME